MGVVPLRTRVQVNLLASVPLRLANEPIEHQFAIALRARAFVGHEVVHVEVLAAVEVVLDPEPRHTPHLALVHDRGEPVPSLSHPSDPLDVALLP